MRVRESELVRDRTEKKMRIQQMFLQVFLFKFFLCDVENTAENLS